MLCNCSGYLHLRSAALKLFVAVVVLTCMLCTARLFLSCTEQRTIAALYGTGTFGLVMALFDCALSFPSRNLCYTCWLAMAWGVLAHLLKHNVARHC
jgi:hypothetical protein